MTGGNPAPQSEGRRGPGRPKLGSEDKRARILAEALRLFSAKGYAGTSLGAIARAADISKAGLLHHFTSKDELFTAVLQERDDTTMADHPSFYSGDIRTVLHAWIGLVRENAGSSQEGTALYTMLSGAVVDPEHPAHHWYVGHIRQAVETLESAFEQSKKEGIVREDTPSRVLARTIVALSDGLQIQMLCARADHGENPDISLPYDTDMVAEFEEYVEAVLLRWLAPGVPKNP